jgi:hypothetical protein
VKVTGLQVIDHHGESLAAQTRVLIVGKSQAVLCDTVALLCSKAYAAAGTDHFDDVLTDFDVSRYDVVVFGGQVPVATREELTRDMLAANPGVVIVQGLAGIAGLIVAQVEGAVAPQGEDVERALAFDADSRRLTLLLAQPREVAMTAWWQTSFVPPDPKSDSLVLVDAVLPAGQHTVSLPDVVPLQAAFLTVRIDHVHYACALRHLDRRR